VNNSLQQCLNYFNYFIVLQHTCDVLKCWHLSDGDH